MNVLERFGVQGKIAVVTGAGRGLGKAYAEGLAGAGAVVVCAGRHGETVEASAEDIREGGGQAEALVLDVTRKEETGQALQGVASRHGALDILVNNAGVEDINQFDSVTEAQYDAIMGVNLKGAYFTAQAAARIMISQGSGKIVNIGSLGSAIGLPGSTVYCGSKTGVLGITRAMAVELAKHNIQVNALGPGYFRTQMTEPFFRDPEHRAWIEERIPAGRVGTAEDLIGAVIFLASPASDYMTGQVIYVDGGWLAS